MAGAAGQGGKLNVFISYSRDDLAFADQLDAALGLTGFDTSIDRTIPGGEEWEKRLITLIRRRHGRFRTLPLVGSLQMVRLGGQSSR